MLRERRVALVVGLRKHLASMLWPGRPFEPSANALEASVTGTLRTMDGLSRSESWITQLPP